MIDNKEVYKITIDPQYSEDGQELGIEQVAFTSKPAVIVKGMAFNSQVKELKFVDDLKYRIVAPAMIPMDIYRNDDAGEYYVQFTESEIENIFSKFMSDLNNRNLFNLEHNQDITVPAYILEAWIVDNPKLDKSYTTYGIEVPKGTLMLTSQITDKEYYKKLVESGQTGFSIEGFMGLKLSAIAENKIKNNMEEILLPENEGKTYIIKDGKFVEASDMVDTKCADETMEKPADETTAEQATETPAEEAPIEDTKVEDVKMALDPAEVMSIIQPKLDELYGVIADLKAQLDSNVQQEVKEDKAEEVALSVHQKFAEVANFLKK